MHWIDPDHLPRSEGIVDRFLINPHGKEEHDGPKHGAKAQHAPMEAERIVRQSLHGPKGEMRGALLEDGRVIRVPPHEAKECEPLLRPGARLAIRGPGLTLDGATVIDAKGARGK